MEPDCNSGTAKFMEAHVERFAEASCKTSQMFRCDISINIFRTYKTLRLSDFMCSKRLRVVVDSRARSFVNICLAIFGPTLKMEL